MGVARPEVFNAATWLVDRHLDAGRGDRVALRSEDRCLTYAELARSVATAGAGLAALGVQPEQRVLVAMVDGPEWVATFLGGLRIGAVPVPVSTMLLGAELGALAADARARVVVLSAAFAEAAGELCANAPEVADLIVAGPAEVAAPQGVRVHRFADTLGAEGEGPDPGVYPTWADSPAFWLYTSGTTGAAKAAMHRHADLRTTAETYAAQVLSVGPDDVCFSVAKLFFAYGLGNSLTFPLASGATTVLDPARPTPAGVAATVAAERPSLFFGVPTFYAALLSSTISDDTFSSVRAAVSAGEPLPAELFHRFKERFGVEILDGLGSTELLHIFLSNRRGAVLAGTSGSPVPGYEVRLVDDEGATVTEADQPGQLLVKGDSAALGYWCRAEATRRTFQGDWTRTGDVYAATTEGAYPYLG
ncbi:MAG TPA: benzoate-CoA ligase family protein, partial [Acidimicrobiales bacterium]|nr:benzoate-CoA ligase family protein [Acidimicrobiales bacterium]